MLRKVQNLANKVKSKNITLDEQCIDKFIENERLERISDLFYWYYFFPTNFIVVLLVQIIGENEWVNIIEWMILFPLVSYTFFNSHLGKRLLKRLMIDHLLDSGHFGQDKYYFLTEKGRKAIQIIQELEDLLQS